MKTFLVEYTKTIKVRCLLQADSDDEACDKHGEGGEIWLQDEDITDDSNLDAYEIDTVILDHEQPATCPKCGSRTAFEDIAPEPDHLPFTGDSQFHECVGYGCDYEFVGVFE